MEEQLSWLGKMNTFLKIFIFKKQYLVIFLLSISVVRLLSNFLKKSVVGCPSNNAVRCGHVISARIGYQELRDVFIKLYIAKMCDGKQDQTENSDGDT